MSSFRPDLGGSNGSRPATTHGEADGHHGRPLTEPSGCRRTLIRVADGASRIIRESGLPAYLGVVPESPKDN